MHRQRPRDKRRRAADKRDAFAPSHVALARASGVRPARCLKSSTFRLGRGQVITHNRLSDSGQPDVRFGSKADICSAKPHVRFTPESDIKCDIVECPLWAKSGLMQCSKLGSLLDHLVSEAEQ